jgi:hypothetical protein
MAWYLNTSRASARVLNLPVPLNVNFGTDAYTIEFESAMSDSANEQFIIGHTSSSVLTAFWFTTGGRFQLTNNGSTAFFSATSYGLFDGLMHKYRIEHDANGRTKFFRDNRLIDSIIYSTSVTNAVPLTAFFRGGSTSVCATLQIKYLQVTGFGAGSDRWDSNLSSGTGSVWKSLSGTNDATQSGTWPSDNTEWTEYIESLVKPKSIFRRLKSNRITANNMVPVRNAYKIANEFWEPEPDYFLNYTYFDAGKYFAVSIPASTNNTGRPLQIEWEIEFVAKKNGTEFVIASDFFNTANTLLFIRTGTDFEFRSSGNTNWLVTTGVTLTEFNTYKIRSTFDGTTATQTLSINGNVIATRTPATAAISGINAFFGLNSSAVRHGDFKYYKFTDYVTPANNRYYQATLSRGSGTVLYESLYGFNGTQVGTWPSNNSEWVGFKEVIIVPPSSSLFKYYDGSAWTAKPLKFHNGSAWVEKTLKATY